MNLFSKLTPEDRQQRRRIARLESQIETLAESRETLTAEDRKAADRFLLIIVLFALASPALAYLILILARSL